MNTEKQIKSLLEAIDDYQGGKEIIIEWKGTKIPRHASIEGHRIGWTQHGIVTSVKGVQVGSYRREIEFGGKNHDEHQMVITPWAPCERAGEEQLTERKNSRDGDCLNEIENEPDNSQIDIS